MESKEPNYLIVGLGNPGSRYEDTRHNIGYQVVRELAKKNQMTFRQNQKLLGQIAHKRIDDKKIYLLMPITYMNNSGQAVRLCIEFFKIEVSRILIIVDDVAIPFGEFRIKSDSGSGGHNGLKSIKEHLKTQSFARLRVGVGQKASGDLADYVLSPFASKEKQDLPNIIGKASGLVELWLNEGVEKAAMSANVRLASEEQEHLGESKE